MPSPADILHNHAQIYQNSCVGWGCEAIALMHLGHLESPYEFQKMTVSGSRMPEFEKILLSRGIVVSSESFGNDFGRFERRAKAEIARGYHPLITIPSAVWVRWEDASFDGSCHTFVVTEEMGNLMFLTWSMGNKGLIKHPLKTMTDLHAQWLSIFQTAGLHTDQLATGIFHSRSLSA